MLFSKLEKSEFQKFRQFMMTPGQMLCFSGPDLDRHRSALHALIEKNLLDQEQFKRGLFPDARWIQGDASMYGRRTRSITQALGRSDSASHNARYRPCVGRSTT
jgi:hypothetical protein